VSAAMSRRTSLQISAALAVVLLLAGAVRWVKRPRPWPPPVTITLASTNGTLEVVPGIGGVLFVLPDGTLWRWGAVGLRSNVRAATPERIGADADWAFAAGGNNGFVAVTRGGELWQSGYAAGTAKRSASLKRVGHDTDWFRAARSDMVTAALKRDGSLWTWGNSTGRGSLGDTNDASRDQPKRVGTHRWRQLATEGSNYGFIGVTGDGLLMAWGQPHQPGAMSDEPRPIHRATNWAAASMHLFLDDTGTLWSGTAASWEASLRNLFAPRLPLHLQPVATNARPGRYAQAGPHLFEIGEDGTLWRRPSLLAPMFKESPNASPARLGGRTDWVRLWSGGGTVLGLTRDGTLWFWGADQGAEPEPGLQGRFAMLRLSAAEALRNLLPNLIGPTTASWSATSPIEAEPRPLLRLQHEGKPWPAGQP